MRAGSSSQSMRVTFANWSAARMIHPGLLILPATGQELSWTLLSSAVAAIQNRGDPDLYMINRVAEVSVAGVIVLFDLPVG